MNFLINSKVRGLTGFTQTRISYFLSCGSNAQKMTLLTG